MRPLYLRAPLVGVALIPLAAVAFIVLTLLALFSKKAEDAFDRLFGEEKDEGELEVRTGPVRVLVLDGTVGEEEVVPAGLTTGLETEEKL